MCQDILTFHSHIYPRQSWSDNCLDSLFGDWMLDIYIYIWCSLLRSQILQYNLHLWDMLPVDRLKRS